MRKHPQVLEVVGEIEAEPIEIAAFDHILDLVDQRRAAARHRIAGDRGVYARIWEVAHAYYLQGLEAADKICFLVQMRLSRRRRPIMLQVALGQRVAPLLSIATRRQYLLPKLRLRNGGILQRRVPLSGSLV